MVEVKNMTESDLLYRLEHIRDQIREGRRRVEKYKASIRRNEKEILRLMREQVVLKEAARSLDSEVSGKNSMKTVREFSRRINEKAENNRGKISNLKMSEND